MGMRFLFSLLVCFLLGCTAQQSDAYALGAVQPVKVKACTLIEDSGSVPASLETADHLKKPHMQRPARSRNTLSSPERYLPDVLFPNTALVFPDLDAPLKDRTPSSATALFCFLQSLLYPKHSFW
ncbi:MAG: hypothetical protein JNL13_06725 [Chitinophagaceae bacterium]|nr:hypothetical protein [Chitinophagaceae bacterium]